MYSMDQYLVSWSQAIDILKILACIDLQRVYLSLKKAWGHLGIYWVVVHYQQIGSAFVAVHEYANSTSAHDTVLEHRFSPT